MSRTVGLVGAFVVFVTLGAGCTGAEPSSSTGASTSRAETVADASAHEQDQEQPGFEVASTEHPIDAASQPDVEVSTTERRSDLAPLPHLPEPAAALPCDGSAVLCVDAGRSDAAADGTVSQPFGSLSDALDAATAGTTVQVAAGTYLGAVVLADVEDLRLIGGFQAGADFSVRDPQVNETVLLGTAEASVVSITASSNIHVEGFRLTGGGGSTDTYSWYGGGVHIDEGSTDIAIVGNRIDANEVDHGDDAGATFGGGIANDGDDVMIIGNVIENNRAGRGAGIASTGRAIIRANTIEGNVSVGDHGGGLYLNGEVSVIENHIEGNRVGEVLGYGWGGGIIAYGDDTTATLQGNVVTGNTAVAAGSGVFIDDGADASLINELYYANTCPLDGGTEMLVDSGGLTPTVADLVNVTLTATDCPDSGNGGALLVEISEASDPPCEVTVDRSILWGNGGDDATSLGCSLVMTNSDLEQPPNGGGNGDGDGDGDGDGNISADPMFVDPEGGDFSLQPGSPAAGLGATEATQP